MKNITVPRDKNKAMTKTKINYLQLYIYKSGTHLEKRIRKEKRGVKYL